MSAPGPRALVGYATADSEGQTVLIARRAAAGGLRRGAARRFGGGTPPPAPPAPAAERLSAGGEELSWKYTDWDEVDAFARRLLAVIAAAPVG